MVQKQERKRKVETSAGSWLTYGVDYTGLLQAQLHWLCMNLEMFFCLLLFLFGVKGAPFLLLSFLGQIVDFYKNIEKMGVLEFLCLDSY